LNAKIESVHVGEQGAGFGLVADEISKQALRSTELTGEIDEAVSELRRSVETAAASLREFAEEDRDRIAASRAEVKQTLDALEAAHWEMRASLSETAERSEHLASDIARCVVALQFQDRTNQRIAHVMEALASMEQALSAEDCSLADREDRRREVVSQMERAYTMEAERTTAASAAPGDVELF
jgi:methyl-accepting chemotaxis protein